MLPSFRLRGNPACRPICGIWDLGRNSQIEPHLSSICPDKPSHSLHLVLTVPTPPELLAIAQKGFGAGYLLSFANHGVGYLG